MIAQIPNRPNISVPSPYSSEQN